MDREKRVTESTGKLHHHRINGALISCYHVCRTRWWLWIPLWLLAQTLSFPFEHYLWEHVPPFEGVTQWLGL